MRLALKINYKIQSNDISKQKILVSFIYGIMCIKLYTNEPCMQSLF